MASSATKQKPNMRSTAVKRIMQEAAELANDAHGEHDFVAAPREEDLFDWHCTIRGVEGSEFEGGLYHFRIVLPPQYPMAAPDIILLTPNGRFELGKKICIDGLTSFHAGSWQPAWGVRTAILGLRSFWMQQGEALSAVGALDAPKAERRRLAKLSTDWVCPCCGVANRELLPDVDVQGEGESSASNGTKPTATPAEASTESSAAPILAQPIAIPMAPAEPQPITRTEKSPDTSTTSSTPTPSLQPGISATELAALTALTAQIPIPQRQTSSRPPLWIDASLAIAVFAFLVLVVRRLA